MTKNAQREPRTIDQAYVFPVIQGTIRLENENGVGTPMGPYVICLGLTAPQILTHVSQIVLLEAQGPNYSTTEKGNIAREGFVAVHPGSERTIFFFAPVGETKHTQNTLFPPSAFTALDPLVYAAQRQLERIQRHDGIWQAMALTQPGLQKGAPLSLELLAQQVSSPKPYQHR